MAFEVNRKKKASLNISCVQITKQTCRGLSRHRMKSQSPEIVETFCYLDDTLGVRGGAFGSIITRMRSG